MYEKLQDCLEVFINIFNVLMIAAIVFMVAELNQRAEEVVYISPDARTLIKELWQDEWPVAHAIIMAESRYKSDRVGDEHLTYIKNGKVYGDSIGIFQIRTFEDRPDRELLKDPYINIHYAYGMYKKQGWSPWSAYNNKSYRKFLPVLKPDKRKIRYKEVSI